MAKVYFISLLHQNYLSHLSYSSCLVCFARTNMHENYVNGPWTGFNVLHIIKKLNKQKELWKVLILLRRTACSRKTRFWGEYLPSIKPPPVPLEKTCLLKEENRLRDLSLYPPSNKYPRFPLASGGFMERDWEVIWKRFLTRKLTKRKINFQFLRRSHLCENRPLLEEFNVCVHRDITIMLAWWSTSKTHGRREKQYYKEAFLLLLRIEYPRI